MKNDERTTVQRELKEVKADNLLHGREDRQRRRHPMTKPHVNSAAMTYELAQDPLYQNLMTADSHLTRAPK